MHRCSASGGRAYSKSLICCPLMCGTRGTLLSAEPRLESSSYTHSRPREALYPRLRVVVGLNRIPASWPALPRNARLGANDFPLIGDLSVVWRKREARLNRPLLPYVARFWTGRQGTVGAMAVGKIRFCFRICVAALATSGSGSPAETTLLRIEYLSVV